MLFIILSLVGGLVFLVLGAESLVKGSVALARKAGVSPLVIGLTIVACGTSMPEFVTAMQAVHVGATGLVVGNVVGSNILNILFILGLTALLAPFSIKRRSLRRDGMFMVATTLVTSWALLTLPQLPQWLGVAAMVAFGVYLTRVYHHEKRRSYTLPAESQLPPMFNQRWVAVCLVLAGLFGLLLGSNLLVDGAVQLAQMFSVPEALIGLTIVALGTTLPELATSITAALRKHPELALGNIVGSNIFNLLIILGSTAALTPVTVPSTLTQAPVWFMAGAAVALLLYARAARYHLGRTEGMLFLGALGVYGAVLFY